MLYIANCYRQGLAASTTRTHLSALSFTFQLSGYNDITQHFWVKKQLQGYSKVKPANDSRLPITPHILSKIVYALPHTTSSAFTSILLHAMYVLAYSAFLRVGEITKTGKSKQHYLLRKHLNFIDEPLTGHFIELIIPHFKHSTSPTTLHIQSNTKNPMLCPYLTCQKYASFRGYQSPDEPLFSFMDSTPVSRQFFTDNLRLGLAFCGLDLQLYKAHSFRIGAASMAAASGSSDIQILNMGRWKSTAYKKYIRIPVVHL